MPEVEKEARLHEETVKQASKHVGTFAFKRNSTSAKSSRVTSTVVHPDVWQTALRLADGDRHRLQVITPTEVRVLNSRS